MKRVNADNAATTAVSATAREAMLPWLSAEGFGNPSGVYRDGREAKRALEAARQQMADALNCAPEEIFFTSCGTESDNWALWGACELALLKGKKTGTIITSAIEHHAITHTCDRLRKYGYNIVYLPVDEKGLVSPDALRAAITDDTLLVSIMLANNEIGTIEPIAELAAIAHEKKILFHTDAVQAVGHIPVDVKALGVDLLSLSAHKFCGPKGVGAMFMRKGLRLPSYVTGGGQERGRRAGTENVAGICGMAAALTEAVKNLDANMARVSAMRDRLIDALLQLPYTRLTGDRTNRLPGTASFVFEGIEGESLVLSLDAVGIDASSGSACSSGDLDPSHVLLAIGLTHEVAHGSLRLSINEHNTDEEIDYILEQLPKIIHRLREMSPMWEDMMKAAKA